MVTTPARTLLDLAAVVPSHVLEHAATEAEIRRLGSPTCASSPSSIPTGCPGPHTNATVDLHPKPREVDCLWPGHRLVADLDGFATHGTLRAFEADRARDRALVVAGYRVVRITWRHLTEDAATLDAEMRELLRTGG